MRDSHRMGPGSADFAGRLEGTTLLVEHCSILVAAVCGRVADVVACVAEAERAVALRRAVGGMGEALRRTEEVAELLGLPPPEAPTEA